MRKCVASACQCLVHGCVGACQAQCVCIPALLPPPSEEFRYDIFNKVVGGAVLSVHKVAFCVVLF